MKTHNPAGAQRPLINTTVAISYSSLYEHAKIEQKRTFDNRQTALDTAVKLSAKVKEPARPDCIRAVRMAFCESGHMFMKPVFCGSESCTYCGQDNSPAHERRIGSILPNVQKWHALSYLVITIPYELRNLYYSKKLLNDFRNFIRRKLKADGFTTATLRWHWAGDCQACKRKKKEAKKACTVCHGTGCGSSYHPHLNILLPAGNTDKVQAYAGSSCKLEPEYLDGWRQSLKKYFQKKHKTKTDYRTNLYHNFVPPVDSFYYCGKARQIVKMTADTFSKKLAHKIRYVTRATLRHPDLINSLELVLKKYKNTSHIGYWEKVPPEPMACPCCEKPLKWYGEPKHKWEDNQHRIIEIKSGMYFLNFLNDDKEPPN